MIRESIARHVGCADRGVSTPDIAFGPIDPGRHASFVRLPLVRGGDDESGACLIEPAVRCNHCGYCQSYGH